MNSEMLLATHMAEEVGSDHASVDVEHLIGRCYAQYLALRAFYSSTARMVAQPQSLAWLTSVSTELYWA